MHKLLPCLGKMNFKKLGFGIRIKKELCVTWKERSKADGQHRLFQMQAFLCSFDFRELKIEVGEQIERVWSGILM